MGFCFGVCFLGGLGGGGGVRKKYVGKFKEKYKLTRKMQKINLQTLQFVHVQQDF